MAVHHVRYAAGGVNGTAPAGAKLSRQPSSSDNESQVASASLFSRYSSATVVAARANPTATLVTAEPRCSTVAQRAARPDASRTIAASENDTPSIPIMVPAAKDTK